jgi:hypothetical protein
MRLLDDDEDEVCLLASPDIRKGTVAIACRLIRSSNAPAITWNFQNHRNDYIKRNQMAEGLGYAIAWSKMQRKRLRCERVSRKSCGPVESFESELRRVPGRKWFGTPCQWSNSEATRGQTKALC